MELRCSIMRLSINETLHFILSHSMRFHFILHHIIPFEFHVIYLPDSPDVDDSPEARERFDRLNMAYRALDETQVPSCQRTH